VTPVWPCLFQAFRELARLLSPICHDSFDRVNLIALQTRRSVRPFVSVIAIAFLHEKRKPEFRIGHLRLASNRNVALRSAELPL
jgi:hypothetical protein